MKSGTEGRTIPSLMVEEGDTSTLLKLFFIHDRVPLHNIACRHTIPMHSTPGATMSPWNGIASLCLHMLRISECTSQVSRAASASHALAALHSLVVINILIQFHAVHQFCQYIVMGSIPPVHQICNIQAKCRFRFFTMRN